MYLAQPPHSLRANQIPANAGIRGAASPSGNHGSGYVALGGEGVSHASRLKDQSRPHFVLSVNPPNKRRSLPCLFRTEWSLLDVTQVAGLALVLLVGHETAAQEALRNTTTPQPAGLPRSSAADLQPHTLKYGDFRLLLTPSVNLEWNDNVTTSYQKAEDDFIFRPMLGLNATYPLTQRRLLALNVGVGYNKYLDHDELSSWYVQTGSGLSFDFAVKDIYVNVHDRFQYQQQSAQESAVAGTGMYGTFQNTAGLSGTWDLQDLTPTLAYDHLNSFSTSSEFQQTDRSTENVVARLGARLHPDLTAGIEGGAAYTTYDQKLLNDNTSYNAGLYGEWRAGSALTISPRAGYTVFSFSQSSRLVQVQASEQHSWYADLTLRHQATEWMTWSLSAGHEVRLGIQSDGLEVWYVRPSVAWNLIKEVSLQTGAFWENGKTTGGTLGLAGTENYEWYGASLSAGYAITKKLTGSLSYRVTFRTSGLEGRDYTQNVVGLQFSYSLR